jgi:hypothetical protein
LLDGLDDPGGHLRGGVPVVGADRTAAEVATAAGQVTHQLINHPGRDAGVLQPGRVGVAELAAPSSSTTGRRSGCGAPATWPPAPSPTCSDPRSPRVAFTHLAAWMLLALAGLAAGASSSRCIAGAEPAMDDGDDQDHALLRAVASLANDATVRT